MSSMKRLDLYRKSRGAQTERHKPAESDSNKHSLLEKLQSETGGDIVSHGGNHYLRVDEQIPADYMHGTVSFKRCYEDNTAFLKTLFPLLTPSGEQQRLFEQMLFFDLETTGLSGGAGTHLFLAGLLRVTDRGVLFTQYFLPNMTSEKSFLEAIARGFDDSNMLVSYNGRSYDYNILKNRFIMTNLPFFDTEPLHLDLLYTSRRIWKGLFPDYSLATVENRALQVRRNDDIPGWLIPEMYASYLRGRNVLPDMLRVLRHNREDVLSLLALLLKQIELVREAVQGTSGRTGKRFNPITLSDMLLADQRRDDAVTLLSEHDDSNEALKRLALLCKRDRQFETALKYFDKLRSRRPGLGDYVFSCTEAAKIYEHQLRDFSSALSCTEKMLRRVERAAHVAGTGRDEHLEQRNAIVHRLKRLKRKLNSEKNK